jgi:predicted AAA+ superfamily ATPase
MPDPKLEPLRRRIADSLERVAPAPPEDADLGACDAFVWHPESGALEAVRHVNCVDLSLLKGIDRVRDILLDNTQRFATGLPANNALLWGARGMGKSSLIKAVHAKLNGDGAGALALVEIHREDTPSVPRLLARLRGASRRIIVFCDDLSFEGRDTSYKSLKAMLEGGIEGRPENVIFYEKVSLSDRFGLWLGFHGCTQEVYLEIVEGYAGHYGLKAAPEALRAEAIEWAMTRGARSGRVAWQFIQDLAGRLGARLE